MAFGQLIPQYNPTPPPLTPEEEAALAQEQAQVIDTFGAPSPVVDPAAAAPVGEVQTLAPQETYQAAPPPEQVAAPPPEDTSYQGLGYEATDPGMGYEGDPATVAAQAPAPEPTYVPAPTGAVQTLQPDQYVAPPPEETQGGVYNPPLVVGQSVGMGTSPSSAAAAASDERSQSDPGRFTPTLDGIGRILGRYDAPPPEPLPSASGMYGGMGTGLDLGGVGRARGTTIVNEDFAAREKRKQSDPDAFTPTWSTLTNIAGNALPTAFGETEQRITGSPRGLDIPAMAPDTVRGRQDAFGNWLQSSRGSGGYSALDAISKWGPSIDAFVNENVAPALMGGAGNNILLDPGLYPIGFDPIFNDDVKVLDTAGSMQAVGQGYQGQPLSDTLNLAPTPEAEFQAAPPAKTNAPTKEQKVEFDAAINQELPYIGDSPPTLDQGLMGRSLSAGYAAGQGDFSGLEMQAKDMTLNAARAIMTNPDTPESVKNEARKVIGRYAAEEFRATPPPTIDLSAITNLTMPTDRVRDAAPPPESAQVDRPIVLPRREASPNGEVVRTYDTATMDPFESESPAWQESLEGVDRSQSVVDRARSGFKNRVIDADAGENIILPAVEATEERARTLDRGDLPVFEVSPPESVEEAYAAAQDRLPTVDLPDVNMPQEVPVEIPGKLQGAVDTVTGAVQGVADRFGGRGWGVTPSPQRAQEMPTWGTQDRIDATDLSSLDSPSLASHIAAVARPNPAAPAGFEIPGAEREKEVNGVAIWRATDGTPIGYDDGVTFYEAGTDVPINTFEESVATARGAGKDTKPATPDTGGSSETTGPQGAGGTAPKGAGGSEPISPSAPKSEGATPIYESSPPANDTGGSNAGSPVYSGNAYDNNNYGYEPSPGGSTTSKGASRADAVRDVDALFSDLFGGDDADMVLEDFYKDYDGDGVISSKDRRKGKLAFAAAKKKRRGMRRSGRTGTTTMPVRTDSALRSQILAALDASMAS
jgi:hypothetical protein